MDARIRERTLADYEAAHARWEACRLPLSESDSRDGIARMPDRNSGMSFVAEANGGLIGTVVGSFDGRRAWLRHLAVAESHRGKGVGRALVARFEAACRERDIDRLSLNVAANNAQVIPFYEELGWSLRQDVLTVSKKI